MMWTMARLAPKAGSVWAPTSHASRAVWAILWAFHVEGRQRPPELDGAGAEREAGDAAGKAGPERREAPCREGDE
jgi:hypothetical protein